jgi:carboxyl-terminal processing protease
LFAVLFGLGWWAGRGRATSDLYANLDLFVEILTAWRTTTSIPSSPPSWWTVRCAACCKDLDPYSQYLDRKSYSNLQDMTHGHFSGIGVVVGVRDNYPTVISPIEGSPAWQAGMTTGDAIVKIEGKSSAGAHDRGSGDAAARR